MVSVDHHSTDKLVIQCHIHNSLHLVNQSSDCSGGVGSLLYTAPAAGAVGAVFSDTAADDAGITSSLFVWSA